MPPSLVDYWREQLAENEREMGDGSSRFTWLHAAYARVYRFLLSFYPEVKPPRTAVPPGGTEGDQVADESWGGKPARSMEQIRRTVAAIHQTHDNPPPVGPLVGGLSGGDWILADRYLFGDRAKAAVKILEANGVLARVDYGRGDWCVLVRVQDLEEARSLLLAIDSEQPLPADNVGPQSPWRRTSTNSDFVPLLLLTSVFALVFGVLFISLPIDNFGALIGIAAMVAFAVFLIADAFRPTLPVPPVEEDPAASPLEPQRPVEDKESPDTPRD